MPIATTVTMGAAASSPFAATRAFYRRIESNHPAVETIDICLACEKDRYVPELRNMSEIKEHFREFMRSVLPTDRYTVFRWSTWDTSDADIVVPTEDLIVARRRNLVDRYRMPQRRIFDAIFTMHCPFGCIDDKSFRTMCSLLKPLGLLVVVSSGGNVHEALAVRPESFGDCSEDTRGGQRYRLHQVHRSTVRGMHLIVWQKWFVN